MECRGPSADFHEATNLSLTKANPPEAAQEPERVTNAPGHHPGCQPEHDSAGRLLGIPLPPRASPTEPQPVPGPVNLVQYPHGLRRAGEELELSIARRHRTKRERLKRKPLISIARQY